MMLAEEISVYQIPIPASQEDVAEYAQIRLATLNTKPEAFRSIYLEASLFTPEQWKLRVETPGRTTFVACRIETDSEPGTDSQLDHTQWVGTLAVLHPELLESTSVSVPKTPRVAEALVSGKMTRYMIVELWVHPLMRRRNVGRTLIQAALDFIKSEQCGASVVKMVMLAVYATNYAAKALYVGMGFEEEMGCENIEDGICIMTTTCL